jgi:hypothetical protein
MLTHVHMVMITWWCWHICEGIGGWAVERGLGSSLPPVKLARRDSGVFEEMKCLFSFTSKVRRSGEVAEGFRAEKHATDAGSKDDGRWRQRPLANPRRRAASACVEHGGGWVSDAWRQRLTVLRWGVRRWSARRMRRCCYDRCSASASVVVTLARGEGGQQRQTRRASGGLPSDASGAENRLRELTGQRLSHRRTHDLQSDRRVNWSGNRPLEFNCAGHVAAIWATDAGVPRQLLSVSASVARDFRPVNC